MAATKNQILSDLELRLTKGKPSDDTDVIRRQLSYLIDIERDRLVAEKLISIMDQRRGQIDPFYIASDLCLSPSKLSDLCVDCQDKQRFAIQLTRDVLSLPRDKGMVRVVDNEGNSLPITTQLNIEKMRHMPFSEPTKANQVVYRENRFLIIEKIDEIGLEYFEYDVFYIPKAEGQSIDPDANYPIDYELVPELTERVYRTALRQQIEGSGDLENDGADPSQYTNPVIRQRGNR